MSNIKSDMTRITLNASELAALSGRNPFKTRRDGWERVLKRHSTLAFTAYVNRIGEVPTWLHSKQVVHAEFPELVESLSDGVPTTTAELNRLREKVNMGIDRKLRRSASLDERKFTKLQKDAELARGEFTRRLNTDFGTKYENRVFENFAANSGMSLQRDPRFYRKSISPYMDLVGRIDARTDDTVVEFKNRMNKLFQEVRDYERVQVMAYMYLLGYEKAILVEAVDGGPPASQEVVWDERYFQGVVRDVLKSFESSAPEELRKFAECPY